MTNLSEAVVDGTCHGPGDVDGRCGRPVQAHGLCPSHVQQLYRHNRNPKKLRPLLRRTDGRKEARGRISQEAADLVSRYGSAALRAEKRKGKALWRGVQVVLEAFGRGDLLWKEGKEPPADPSKKARGKAS